MKRAEEDESVLGERGHIRTDLGASLGDFVVFKRCEEEAQYTEHERSLPQMIWDYNRCS